MAKSKEIAVQEAEILSPEQETQALITLETDKLIDKSIGELRKSTVTDQALAHLTAEYSALAIAGIDDLNGYKAVKEGASKLKKIRTSIKARREELTEPALKFQRALIAEEKRIVAIIEPLEAGLNAKKKDYEDAVEAKKREVYTQRVNALTQNGFQLINGFFVCGPVQVHSDELARITEAQMEVHIKHGQSELERRAAEEKRRQEEAERQRQEQERLNAERAEIERMRAELEAEKAKVAAELAAQTQAIETTYDTVVQPVQPMAPVEAMTTQEPQFMPPPAYEQLAPQTEPQACPTSLHDSQAPTQFMQGFDAFRVQLINLVTDTSLLLTRKTLKEWAETVQYPQH